jgi:hypothetical protein
MLDGFSSALRVASDQFSGGAVHEAFPGTSLEIAVMGGDIIILRGRAMPFEGVDWPVEQRTKKTLYPGNPDATIQVLGPEELPTVMEGKWDDRYMDGAVLVNGNPATCRTARELAQIFETICLSGHVVRVQWQTVVRYGLIKKFTPNYLQASRLEWSAEFEWATRDDEQLPKPPVLQTLGQSMSLRQSLNVLTDVLTLAPNLARSLSESILSDIESVREDISTVIDSLYAVETLLELPATIYGGLEAAVNSIVLQLEDHGQRLTSARNSALPYVEGLSDVSGLGAALRGATAPIEATAGATMQAQGRPTEEGSTGTAGHALSSAAPAFEAQFEGWRRSVYRAIRALQFDLLIARENVRAEIRPVAQKQITLREGETLYQISSREYGSPDFAGYLASVNRLQTVAPRAGTVIRIPARPNGSLPEVSMAGTRAQTTRINCCPGGT